MLWLTDYLSRPLTQYNRALHITRPGIHNVGSYGTRGIVKAADGNYEDRLGFIADYNRTGWANGFGGDYFMNDDPIEGIVITRLFINVIYIYFIGVSAISFNCFAFLI